LYNLLPKPIIVSITRDVKRRVEMSLRILVFEALIYASLATKNMFSQYFDLTGYSSVEIGFLMAVLPVISLFSSPFWFRLGQKIGESRVYYIVSLASIVLIWPVFLSTSFPLAMLFMIGLSFFFSGVVPIGDSLIMSSIKLRGGLFSRVRLCGTLGFAVISLLMSQIVGVSFFWLFAVGSVVLILSLFTMRSEETGKAPRKSIRQSREDGTLFEFGVMTVGMFFGITLNSFHNSFIPIFTREMGMAVSAVGVIFAITALSEIPFLAYADRIIAKLGNTLVLEIGMLIIAIRMILISFSTNTLFLYSVELLHGLTYILMYYSLFDYIHFRLPKKHLTSAQSVFWTIRSGMTFIAGSIGGGFVIQSFSITFAFRVFGIAGLIATAGMFILTSRKTLSRRFGKVKS